MALTLRGCWTLGRNVLASWSDDYAPSMGAALAFYTMFSMAPLLLIVIAVAGLVFGQDAARGAIAAQLVSLMGEGGARAVQDLLAAAQRPEEGVAATAIGAGLLVVGATTVFAELQSALNRIWRVSDSATQGGLSALVRARLLSFGMVLALGFLAMVSLAISAGLAAASRFWNAGFADWYGLAVVANNLIGFALVAVMFALIYKVMPRARVQWKDVWIGALFTAALFTVGKYLIGMYVGRSSVTSVFGAAGSLVGVLLWVYYSAQIFLLGAEFTWVYANSHGSRAGKAAQAGLEASAGAATLIR